jgi:transposase InsO family protein
VKRLRNLCNLNTATILDVARRPGLSRQPKRPMECAVRGSVVSVANHVIEQGYTLRQAADFLHLCPRTLREWQADCRHDLLHVHLLGRPLARPSVSDRNLVIELLDELGPATGIPTLRTCFPTMARAELEDILKRYRRVWRKLNLEVIHRLRWPIPGRVWAIDFTQAPSPIDGRFPYLLAVRDLASGQQLLWQPTRDLTAAVAQDALAALFDGHGSPLVLKMDNGSAFIAEALQNLLRPEVTPLFSPPYYPRYNGAIEAGIGSLKTRTQAHASCQGHPAYWTCDDVAAAQDDANHNARPRGPSGPAPNDLWMQRSPITTDERQRFHDTLQRRQLEARLEHPIPLGQDLTTKELRSLERKAISRALVELGYLLFSRRRIHLAIKKQKVTRIR